MKMPRWRLAIGALGLGLALLALFQVSRGKQDRSSEKAETSSTRPGKKSAEGQGPAERAVTSGEPRDKRLNPLFRDDQLKVSLEDLDPYFEARGRGVMNLLAAFQACRDQRILAELLERFPDDSRAMATVMFSSDYAEDRAKGAGLLAKIQPDSSLPLMAGTIETTDPVQLDALLKELESKPELSIAGLGNQAENYELAKTFVADPVRAWAYSVNRPDRVLGAQREISMRINELIEKTGTTGSEELKKRAQAVSLSLLDSLAGEYEPGSIDFVESSLVFQQLAVMKHMDADLTLDGSTLTIGERTKELEGQITDKMAAIGVSEERLKNAEPSVADEYVRLWITEGKTAANKFIISAE